MQDQPAQPVAPQAQPVPQTYNPDHLAKDAQFYSGNPQALNALMQKVDATTGIVSKLQLEIAQRDVMLEYSIPREDADMIEATTIDGMRAKAEKYTRRLAAARATDGPPPPPEIKLPEPQYTPQEAQRLRIEYDVKNDPEAQALLRKVRGY
jgi:hypothetical protein